ncbi:MAG: type II secretion system protein GspG [Planctomycetota bacterium]|jgi:type II secretion system protein G
MSDQDYAGAYGPAARNSDLALFSLIAGVLAWFLFPIFGAIAAVIMGHMALGEMRRSGGAIGGRGMAVGGLILGYVQVVAVVLGVLLFLAGAGLFFFVASKSDVQVDGDKVVVTGPVGAKIEVDEASERVHVVAPGAEIRVDGEDVVVKGPRGSKIEVHDKACWSHGPRGKKAKLAKSRAAAIEKALVTFRLNANRFPTEKEGLAALMERPGGLEGKAWEGPYMEELPVDPWGNPYRYSLTGGERGTYALRSLGPDGVPSEDDIE